MPADNAASPSHLSALAKRAWRDVLEEYELEPTALLLLRAGLEQFDLYERARKELAKAGKVTVSGRSGVMRQHPAAKVAADALREARQCFRQLGLEIPDPDQAWKRRALGRRGDTDGGS